MEGKKKTVAHMKAKREVPDSLRKQVKEFNRIKKTILNVLEPGPMTIPEIAGKTGLEPETVTYSLMTMRKFGTVETDRMDDMDEYYYYRVKEKPDGESKS